MSQMWWLMTDLCFNHVATSNATMPRNISTIVIRFTLRKFITRFAHKHFVFIIITLNSHVIDLLSMISNKIWYFLLQKYSGRYRGFKIRSYNCRVVIHIVEWFFSSCSSHCFCFVGWWSSSSSSIMKWFSFLWWFSVKHLINHCSNVSIHVVTPSLIILYPMFHLCWTRIWHKSDSNPTKPIMTHLHIGSDQFRKSFQEYQHIRTSRLQYSFHIRNWFDDDHMAFQKHIDL